MADDSGRPRPAGGQGGTPPGRRGEGPRPLFRDEVPAPGPDAQETAVQPAAPHSAQPFPPLRHQGPPRAESAAPPPGPAPQAYPPQPPATGRPPTGRPPVPPRAAPPTGPPAGPPTAAPPRRRRRRMGRRRWLIVVLVLFLVLPAALYFFADSKLERVNAFPAANTRPVDTPGTNWLIVGSDSREGLSRAQRQDLATGVATGRRTDTMMLLHIPNSGGPTLVSLPRDSYVAIPGRPMNRLNAAFAFGGPKLLIRTVEDLTDIRVDHYAEIGFGGLFDVVNAVGGVEMCFDEAKKDPKAGLDIAKGCQNLDGGEALGVARTRASTRGDLDRVNNQRELISAIMDKATSPSTLINPWRAFQLATDGAGALTVAEGDYLFDLARLAWAMRSLGSDGTTTTVPIGRSFLAPGVGAVITWDEARAATLFDALRRDQQVPKSALQE